MQVEIEKRTQKILKELIRKEFDSNKKTYSDYELIVAMGQINCVKDAIQMQKDSYEDQR